MAYQEGQLLQGSDGKRYRVVNGVPREEAAAPAAPAPQQAAPSPPAAIPGRTDPYKQTAEQRAQSGEARAAEDQAIQRRQLEITEGNAARAAAADQRSAEQAAAGSVEQNKAAGFLRRAINAETSYGKLDIGPRGLVGQAVAENFPNAANTFFNSSERQQADQAEREFIAAILRYDSGAAIPPEEFISNGQIYFPRPGDSEEVIKQKAQSRRTAIEGLLQSSGPAGTGIALPPEGGGPDQQNAGSDGEEWTRDKSIAFWGRELVTEDGSPLGPDGGYAQDKETGEWSLVGRMSDGNPGESAVERRATELDESQGKVTRLDLAGQGLTLGLMDESTGIGTAIGSALTGDFDVVGNYNLGRDAANLRFDRAREEYGWTGTAAEVLGGGGLGKVGSGVNSLLGVGRGMAARGQAITRSGMQAQMARNAARDGALVGGVGGFGYGEGEGRATNALIGAATGGSIGYVGQRIGNAIANRGASPAVSGSQVQQAADDLDIPVIPAVTGGTTARRLTSGARQGFISDRPIAAAVEAMETGGAAARDRTAAATGRVLDGEEAGDVVRQAANVYSRRTSDIGGKLYRRADNMAGGEKLPLPAAIQAADTELAQLAKGPGGKESALYKDIEKLRRQMASGKFEVDGVRAFRSRLRNELTERGLRGTPQDVAFSRILQAAEDDMITGLTSAGKGNAAGALRTAADFWRKRVETIDDVLEPVLGKNAPKSGEQIVTAIERLAHPKTGNASRLRQLFQAMPKDEANSTAATIITRMGRPTAGAGEKADDGGFSFNTFLTNWNNMSPQARAAMFPQETRAALDKLATVSRGVKQAGSAMNTSNTAGALTAQAAISGIPWLVEPLSAVGITGSQWVVGRLLASPRIARWVSGAPRNPSPQARNAYVARLGGIARAEPALANEIGLLQRAANDNVANVSGAAAEEPNEKQR